MGDDERIRKLKQAFKDDGWDFGEPGDISHEGQVGIVATHQAKIGTTEERKKAYYVEGSPYHMGYLMGLMAEPTISSMCLTESRRKILGAFIGENAPGFLIDAIDRVAIEMAPVIRRSLADKYPQFEEEIKGMVEGCKAAARDTTANEDALWALNVGFDAIMAFIYTEGASGELLELVLEGKGYKIPLMCNAFSVFGGPPDNRFHFMGRDFMFATGDIIQKYITTIIHKPSPPGYPFVSITVPGMIGSFTAMNINGVGIGVDMSPAGNCDAGNPGLNSLLLNRDAIQNGADLQGALQRIVDAPRGVSWIYVLADGSGNNHRACVVEAGKKEEDDDHFRDTLLDYPPDPVWNALEKLGVQGAGPGIEEQLQSPSTPYRKGLMVRTPEYVVPVFYQALNQRLVDDFREKTNPDPWEGAVKENPYSYRYIYSYRYDDRDWASGAFINTDLKQNNSPMSFCFPPLRNDDSDILKRNLLVATNFFLIPEMRLCQMHHDSSIIGQDNWDEMQWRYDTLSRLLRNVFREQLDFNDAHTRAKEIANFLSPLGPFADTRDYYYVTTKKRRDQLPPEHMQVHGSVSLMDLKNKKIESLYGYYGDEWVGVSLTRYA